VATTSIAEHDPWRLSASRAAHPSQQVAPQHGPEELLGQIAAGLGAVVVPADVLGTTGDALSRELLLTTPAYDVWLMNWPAGTQADLHQHDAAVAFHVVSGAVVEVRLQPRGQLTTAHAEGDTVVVPAHTPHRLESSVASTTVHVHAKELP
jgi:quercetin dioxygenase-like cupin family protein